jgi:hypothetical protein
MIPTILHPTRITTHSATLIDNIFTNFPQNIINSNIVVTDISDHFPIITSFDIKAPPSTNSIPSTAHRKINHTTISKLNETLENLDWTPIYTACNSSNPELAYDQFIAKYKEIYDISLPLQTVKSKRCIRTMPVWMTEGLLKSCGKKNRLYVKYLKKPTPANKNKFIKFRNCFKSARLKAERLYYTNYFAVHKNNLKQTWNGIRNILNSPHINHNIEKIIINDRSINNPPQIAQAFNDYFSTIGQTLFQALPPHTNDYHDYLHSPPASSLFLTPTTPEELLSLSHSISCTHSTGIDDIDPVAAKSTLPYIAKPLSAIINASLQTGIIPSQTKIAKVTPIFKNGIKTELGNYRPISILPYFSKYFEKIVYNRTYSFITKLELLNPNQFGFQQGKSTSMAAISLHDFVSGTIDQKQLAIGIFLDLAKAFDSVDHSILIEKLPYYGIRGTALNWLTNYLSDRHQYVLCNETLSPTPRPILFGVPQGSILGPLLFLLFINDLPNSSTYFKFLLFADDTNLLASDSSLHCLHQNINTELINITDWFTANHLTLNPNKTTHILFCSHSKHIEPNNSQIITINNTPLKQVNSCKFLGLVIDHHLTWQEHINSVENKIAKNVGILSKLTYKLPKHILLTLYHSLIQPYISYCNIVWASTYKTRLNKIFSLQKKALTKINGVTLLTSNSHQAKHLCVYQLNTFLVCEFMYKFTRHLLPTHFNTYFCYNNLIHSHDTRSSHDFNITFARTNYRLFSIKHRGPSLFNSLPAPIKKANNITSFKKLLRIHLMEIKAGT